MYTKLNSLLLLLVVCFSACTKNYTESLQDDLQNIKRSDEFIIAYAAGMQDGFMGDKNNPMSFFFYPVEGATNFRYYETNDVNIDKTKHSLYFEKEVFSKDVFNGYLKRFPLGKNKNNRWAIMTYLVNDSIRICDPVQIKIQDKPTVWNPETISISSTNLNPSFSWENGPEDVIHFQVISNHENNLISGSYTQESNFTFYDLSNVVLNITSEINPTLENNKNYTFTLMSVSDDNWVNSFAQKSFNTP